jgi:hypothetical protein
MGFTAETLRALTTRRERPQGRPVRLRDRFELLLQLGSGGFGTVWEGFDMLLERPVAIKELVIDEQLTDRADALREARATARLNHPAIVSLYEVVSEEDRIYMINELVHGHTLAEMIEHGQLSDNDSGRIGYALCEALAHAHGQGVVHRDVKPANVMVTTAWLEGSGGWRLQPAKLMDFGIASIVDPGEHGGHAHAGPHAGSRGYVAPEQLGGQPATPASDVYSLALVLFECFAGTRPGRGRRARLARVRRDLPASLTWTIDACLDQEPSLRPTVSELGATIHDVLPELTQQLSSPSFSSRIHGLLDRGQSDRSAGISQRPAAAAARAEGGMLERFWRLGLAALAAAVCALTMLAAAIEPSFLAPLAAGVLVFLMPRAGWALAATAGATYLAITGQVGSAMFLVLPAIVAAVAAMVPLGRVLDGALAGGGAFLWVVAVQAMSGTSLALSLPPGSDESEAVREFGDVALHTLVAFSGSGYLASLGLWSLTGALAMMMLDRRAPLGAWAGLLVAFFALQVTIGQLLAAPVPGVTIAAVTLLALVLVGLAIFGARAGRVNAARPVRAGPAQRRGGRVSV